MSLLPGRNKPLHGDVCDVPGPSSTGTKHLVEKLTGPEFESKGGVKGVKYKPRPDLTAAAIAVPLCMYCIECKHVVFTVYL